MHCSLFQIWGMLSRALNKSLWCCGKNEVNQHCEQLALPVLLGDTPTHCPHHIQTRKPTLTEGAAWGHMARTQGMQDRDQAVHSCLLLPQGHPKDHHETPRACWAPPPGL